MKKTNFKYRLNRNFTKQSSRDWDRYDFVFFLTNPNIANNEEFAKILVTLQICKHDIRLNCQFTLQWFTVRDEIGNKLKDPDLGWSYSDGFNVPRSSGFPEKLGDAKFAEFVENLIDTTLYNWVNLKGPLQKSFDGALETECPEPERLSA